MVWLSIQKSQFDKWRIISDSPTHKKKNYGFSKNNF